MQVNVKFFASLREQLGNDEVSLLLDEVATMAEIWGKVTDQPAPENLLCSRNLQYAEWDDLVEDGDEIAFFPPVTGG